VRPALVVGQGEEFGADREVCLAERAQPGGGVTGEPGLVFGDDGGRVVREPRVERSVVDDEFVEPGVGAAREVPVGGGARLPGRGAG
jgi:hypothetical protein